eukprot:7388229-Prymnesium_polylepis.2
MEAVTAARLRKRLGGQQPIDTMKQTGNEREERELASPGPTLQPCELFVGEELFSPRALSPVEPIDEHD